MPEVSEAIRPDRDGGVRVAVRVVTRAARTEVAGAHGGALKVRVTAPPVGGKANRAVCGLLAERLGVRAADCEVVTGRQSRDKVVRVRGVTCAQVVRALDG